MAHRLSKAEQEERNRGIQKMIEYGCSYADISRRYGIHPNYIKNLKTRGKIEKTATDCFGNPLAWERGSVDNIG